MIDCPTCHRSIDGLFCAYCRPKVPRQPPIPAATKAKIDATLRAIGRRFERRRDPEELAERAAIVDEGR